MNIQKKYYYRTKRFELWLKAGWCFFKIVWTNDLSSVGAYRPVRKAPDYWKIRLEVESRRRRGSPLEEHFLLQLKWSWRSASTRRRRRRLRILLEEVGFESMDKELILLATYFKDKWLRPPADYFVRALVGSDMTFSLDEDKGGDHQVSEPADLSRRFAWRLRLDITLPGFLQLLVIPVPSISWASWDGKSAGRYTQYPLMRTKTTIIVWPCPQAQQEYREAIHQVLVLISCCLENMVPPFDQTVCLRVVGSSGACTFGLISCR